MKKQKYYINLSKAYTEFSKEVFITNGESQIDKVVAVMPDGRVGSPCGACREYMMQLDKDSGEIEILLDLDNQKTVKLKDLIPDWWGTHKFTE